MQLVQTIIAHGDLTDIAFTEKAFGAKFSSQSNVATAVGETNRPIVRYGSVGVLGNPISVILVVDYSKATQLENDQIAVMGLDSLGFPSPQPNFITDCLNISTSDLSAFFGGGFDFSTPGLPSGDSGTTKEIDLPGKRGSRLYLNIGYNLENMIVDHIAVVQRP
jgi:hypothetical protein